MARARRSRPRVVIGLMFFPRGGSAHVVRSLARALPAHGWDVTIVSGSVNVPGRPGDAREFFAGLDVHPVDMTSALRLDDPLLGDPPLHPSYEDRPGQSDRVFARVDDAVYEHQVEAWRRALEHAGAGEADLLHLNHLTPMNEAADRLGARGPIVGHIHGTEVLMLGEIAAGPPPGWGHADVWRRRMHDWATRCARLIVLTEPEIERTARLLGIDSGRFVAVPNGCDIDAFDRRPIDAREHWRRYLVEDPRGWRPGEEAGSVRYTEEDLAAFDGDAPVLLYVGRFTDVKRVGLMIQAHARAQPRLHKRAPLVLIGGFPGEWEGEHPVDTIERVGARDVFLAGWHDHAELPESLNAADVVVLASVRERFGQVLAEGMACGSPAIAVDAYGPATIIDDGETGWLVPPDDEQALADAIVAAVDDPAERARRGANAYAVARARYSWSALAARVAATYEAARRG